MDKKNLIIGVLSLVIISGLVWIAIDKISDYKQNIIVRSQQDFTNQLLQTLATCQEIPVDIGNGNKITIIAKECLKS